MDQIREQIENLAELDDAQLSTLKDQILAAFEAIEDSDVTPEVIQSMTELVSAMDTVKNELSARETQMAELTSAKEAAIEAIRGSEESEEETPAEDAEETPADEDAEDKDDEVVLSDEAPAETELAVEEPVVEEVVVETPAETEASVAEVVAEAAEELAAEEEVVEAPAETATELAAEETTIEENTPVETELSNEAEEPAVAEVSEETELNTRKDSEGEMSTSENESPLQAPETHAPAVAEEAANDVAQVTIVASGDIPGVTMGSELPDMLAVADAMTKRIHQVRRTTGGDGETFSVATLNIAYPESRTLRSGDVDSNNAKIKAVASPEAIVAAGGFCAPVEVSYDIFGFGVTDRPVKDSLATFSADRGGIRYSTSPVLGDLDGAVSLWTLQNDIDAAEAGGPDPTKPCLRVVCGQEVVVYTDAIPLCLTFGNLQSRAFPELVARNNELALITHARYAETRILTRIGALSTQVSAPEKLGAARDFFEQVDRAAAAYRSRHRLAADESLRIIVPLWLKNEIRSDLIFSMPAGSDEDRFGIADNVVNGWFAARHINVTWTLDGEAASSSNDAQIFGAQTTGILKDWPANVVWYLFAEGTFLFLDGGTLDLGLVRDSTLNATNDYKMFVETFEGVAKVGVESLRIVSSLDVTGASAGTVDPATL